MTGKDLCATAIPPTSRVEVDSAALYETLSNAEKNPQLAQVYSRLASIESAHAEFWKRQIEALGQRVPQLRPGFRTRDARMAGPPVRPVFRAADGQHPRARWIADLTIRAAGSRRRWLGGRWSVSHARIIEALALAPSPTGLSGATLASGWRPTSRDGR